MSVKVNGLVSDQLTTGADIAIVKGDGKDKIYATFIGDGSAGTGSTLTPADSITGNGKTVLNLSLADSKAGPTALPGVSVSGLRTLNVKDLTSGAATITLDATNWGNSLENIGLYGSSGLELQVNNLTLGSKLVATAKGDDQDIDINTATFGSGTLTVDVENKNTDAVAAKAVVKSDSILAKAGLNDKVTISHDIATAAVGAVSLSSVTVDSLDTAVASTIDINLGGAGSYAVGDVSIGEVHVHSNKGEANLKAEVNGTGGIVTVGKVAIDSLHLLSATTSASSTIDLSATNLNGDASIGNIVIKDLTSSSSASANLLKIDVLAEDKGGVAGVATIGRLNLADGISAVSAAGSFTADINLEAKGAGGLLADANSIKAIAIGDITAIDSNGGDVDIGISATVTHGGIGNVRLGNVEVGAASLGGEASFSLDLSADKALGNLTIGDLSAITTATATGLAEVKDVVVDAAADTVGVVKVGDIVLASAGAITGANNGIHIESTSKVALAEGVKSFTVGDVHLDATGGAATEAFGAFDLHVKADQNVGATTIDTINIEAGSVVAQRAAELNVDVTSTNGSVGAVTVGNIELDATNVSTATLVVNVSGSTGTGLLKLGTIDLFAETASGKASLIVDVDSTGVVEVGNITIGENVINKGSDAYADVTFDTTNANITLGNIVVTGDAATSDYEVLDYNDSKGSWLDADAGTATVTVGDIDYSGFDGATTIDVDGWVGASNIYGSASGDNDIAGNKGQNTIHLAVAGAGADTIFFMETQSNGTVAATADLIKNFDSANDDFVIKTSSGTGTEAVAVGTFATYAAFLAYVETTNNDTVYAAKIAGDNTWYVAVDADGTAGTDYVYKVEGTLSDSDFSYI